MVHLTTTQTIFSIITIYIQYRQVVLSFGIPGKPIRSRSDVRYCVSDFVKRRLFSTVKQIAQVDIILERRKLFYTVWRHSRGQEDVRTYERTTYERTNLSLGLGKKTENGKHRISRANKKTGTASHGRPLHVEFLCFSVFHFNVVKSRMHDSIPKRQQQQTTTIFLIITIYI